ncbi:hypothetical protein ACFWEV_35070 [Streptomyces bacillaris]|uniref:hypothetical protein n=1 Tax=Streptomyces bacillaris TaxID=68179 RepID=UPI0036601043
MTTATRPLPPHGTYARANGSPGRRQPCHCEPCTTTRTRRKKAERIDRQRGVPRLIDAAPARARIAELRATTGWDDLAAALGTRPGHLRDIANGTVTHVRRSTHERIMAVQPPATPGLYIDATGTVRRIRALMAAGHAQHTIAALAGSTQYRISLASQGPARVRRMFADKIADTYRELAGTTGTSARARTIAAAAGWPDPLWWEDYGGLDDPKAPETEPQQNQRTEAAYKAGEVRHLASYGLKPDEIAARVGYSTGYVEQLIAREAS